MFQIFKLKIIKRKRGWKEILMYRYPLNHNLDTPSINYFYLWNSVIVTATSLLLVLCGSCCWSLGTTVFILHLRVAALSSACYISFPKTFSAYWSSVFCSHDFLYRQRRNSCDEQFSSNHYVTLKTEWNEDWWMIASGEGGEREGVTMKGKYEGNGCGNGTVWHLDCTVPLWTYAVIQKYIYIHPNTIFFFFNLCKM